MLFSAKVITGLGLGRKTGYPTINLSIPKNSVNSVNEYKKIGVSYEDN